MEALATISAGKQIGPYLVDAPLGRGSTAVVYRAVHAFLDRQVALKVVADDEEPQLLERFLDEARVLARLSHPGLVRIHDCGILPQGGAFLAMELLEGELLHDRMHRMARMPLAEMVDIVRQLADALEVVHDAGLVHRDVKPSNIFLTDEGVKLLDFGLAKQLDRRPRTLPGMLMGTPYYMSPEQCRGAVRIDRRADVYALGCVLFQMATGRPPFDRISLPEVIEAHLLHKPPSLATLAPELPPAVGEVVARALAKSPEDRFSCALAMANALTDAAGRHGPITAPMKAAAAFDPNQTIPHKAVAAALPHPTRVMTPVRPRRQMALAVLVTVAVTCAVIFVISRLAAPDPPAQMATTAAAPEPPPPATVEQLRVVEIIRGDEPPKPRRKRPVAAPAMSPEPVAASPRPRPALLDPFGDR